jgi:hypothetical protein
MRTLQASLSKFVNDHHTDWVEYLPMIRFAYNSSVQESIGFTPCRLMLGREVVTPSSFIAGRTPDEVHDVAVETYVDYIWRIGYVRPFHWLMPCKLRFGSSSSEISI